MNTVCGSTKQTREKMNPEITHLFVVLPGGFEVRLLKKEVPEETNIHLLYNVQYSRNLDTVSRDEWHRPS
jgi:hypothetical protein